MSNEDLFPNTLKLCHFWNKHFITLSIKVAANSVFTIYIDKEQFQKMMETSFKSRGYEDGEFQVLVKRDYVKFSKTNKDTCSHFRFELNHWLSLVEDYKEKLKVPEGDCFTCVVE